MLINENHLLCYECLFAPISLWLFVFYHPPDHDYFRQQVIPIDFDVDDYLQALITVPIVSKQRIDYLLKFFFWFFDLLIRIGYENKQRYLAELEIKQGREQLESRVEERTIKPNRALIEVGDLAAQLNESLKRVGQLAVTDSLTETYNRRKFDEIVVKEHQLASSLVPRRKVSFSYL